MTAPTVHAALTAAMKDVQAIGKGDQNKQQGYWFRGVDAVVKAVGPVFREHGIIVVPLAGELIDERYDTRKEAKMRGVTVKMGWRFYGPAGDFIEAATWGEAADAGDKAVAKAQSVAYRVVLLQALCIPTDERDPDADSHERADEPPRDPVVEMRATIKAQGDRLGLTVQELTDDFAGLNGGLHIASASMLELAEYRKVLEQRQPADA